MRREPARTWRKARHGAEPFDSERVEGLDHKSARGYGFDPRFPPHDVENAPFAVEPLAHRRVGAVIDDKIGTCVGKRARRRGDDGRKLSQRFAPLAGDARPRYVNAQTGRSEMHELR